METDNAQEQIHGRTDYRDPGGTGAWHVDSGCLPASWRQLGHLLQMEGEVRRHGVSDARRLKTLETENTRLKKLLADSMLDNSILKDLLGKS
jgi:hypothetical protein